MEKGLKIETIDDVIEFIGAIKTMSNNNTQLPSIKSLNFTCDYPNHISKFSVEYFSIKLPDLPGGVKLN